MIPKYEVSITVVVHAAPLMADMLIVALRGAGRLMTANREGVFYLRLCGRSRSSCRSRCRCFCRCRFCRPAGSRSTGARLLRLSRLAGGVVLLIGVLSGRGGRCGRSRRCRCGSHFRRFRNRCLTLACSHVRTCRIGVVFPLLAAGQRNRDAAHSSSLYVLSTLLSIMTMPLMIGLFDMLV